MSGLLSCLAIVYLTCQQNKRPTSSSSSSLTRLRATTFLVRRSVALNTAPYVPAANSSH